MCLVIMIKKILSIFIFAISIHTIAQPTITENTINFSKRARYLTHTDSINPNLLLSGNNVTWDFSFLKGNLADSIIYTLKTSQSNFGTFFPTANEVINDYSFIKGERNIENFYYRDQNKYLMLGSAYQPNNISKYNPPRYLLKFPFEFNKIYSDSSLTGTIKYDGYGTLKLPDATYSNVYRVTSKDSLSPTSVRYTYRWFDNEKRLLTLYINEFYTQALFYSISNKSSTVNAKSLQVYNTIFPNPSNGKFYIEQLNYGDQICLFNALGQMVYKKTAINSKEEIQINTKGIFYIQINGDNKSRTQKLIIQ